MTEGIVLSGPTEGWLDGLRLAANLAIVAANASIVGVLMVRYRRGGSGLPAPRWHLAALAVAVGLCGVSHLAASFGSEPVESPGPGLVALKGLTAAFWVVAAMRLPALVARLDAPVAGCRTCPPAPDGRALDELTALAESFARDRTPIPKLPEPARARADLETDPCRS